MPLSSFNRFYLFIFCQINRPDLGIPPQYLVEGFEHLAIQAYYNLMVDVAVMFGATRKLAERELYATLEFQRELALV